jgi:hypothetical protein
LEAEALFILPVGKEALAGAVLRKAILAPVRVLGGHDPFDRAQPVVQPPRGVMELVQQFLVRTGQRRGGFPLGDVVKDDPRQANEQD